MEPIKKEISNIKGLNPTDSVTIWKLNYGFIGDLQEVCIDYEVDELGKNQRKINITKTKLYWLIFGIYEAPCLEINPINDVGFGLTEEETKARLKIVRNLDKTVALDLYDKITTFNEDEKTDSKESDEVIKK